LGLFSRFTNFFASLENFFSSNYLGGTQTTRFLFGAREAPSQIGPVAQTRRSPRHAGYQIAHFKDSYYWQRTIAAKDL